MYSRTFIICFAVFIETWMDGGKGNALGSYDEMFFRTRTLENSRIYSAQGLESEGTSADFMSKANSYYYGTRFLSYVAHQYGPTNLIEWIKRKDLYHQKNYCQMF